MRTNVFHYKIIWKIIFSEAGKLLIAHLLLVTNQVTTSSIRSLIYVNCLPNAYDTPSELTQLTTNIICLIFAQECKLNIQVPTHPDMHMHSVLR